MTRETAFYDRPAENVARDLLGDVLVSTIGGPRVAGRIVETEAYVGPHDPASHAREKTGRTARNAAMFGPAGRAYVYRIYGIHWCLNAVTGPDGFPAAVLIRALEPVDGLDAMRLRRWGRASERSDRELASGPGRLAQALGITGELDGHPLQRPPLVIETGTPIPDEDVLTGPRIGVVAAETWPLRFYLPANPHVSR